MPEPPAPPPVPDLAAIAARAAAATPEPWVTSDGTRGWPTGHSVFQGSVHGRLIVETAVLGGLSTEHVRADATFIAAARQDVPALVAYARALEAETVRLRTGLRGLRREHTISSDYYETCPKAWDDHTRAYIRAHHPDWEDWLNAGCECGADAHNAKIDALLNAP